MESVLAAESLAAPVTADASLPRLRWRSAYLDWLIAAALSFAAVLAPALISVAAGSFTIPANDDWAYRFSAVQFAHTGHLVYMGWGAMTLIGQVLWSWPFLRVFGDHGWVFGASTGVLAAIGVSCAYYIARRLLPRAWACAAVLLIAAVPGFAWSASTFMTDVPMFAADMACLALGIAALDRQGRWRWALLASSFAAGVFAFSIREFGIVAPIAVLLTAIAAESPRRRLGLVAAGAVMLASCAAIYVYSGHLPGAYHEVITKPQSFRIWIVSAAFFTFALAVSPAVAVAAWRHARPRISPGTIAFAAVIALGVMQHHHGGMFVGNYLAPTGILGTFVLGGGRPTLLPHTVWSLLAAIAVLSGALIAWMAVDSAIRAAQRVRSWRCDAAVGLVGVFTALLGGGLTVFALTVGPFWDRYLWCLIFAAGVLLLRSGRAVAPSTRHWPRAATVAALSAVLAVVAVATTLNADAYDAARWHAGQRAVALGVRAGTLDAGMEWVGAHTGSRVRPGFGLPPVPYQAPYTWMNASFIDCGFVTDSPWQYPHVRLLHVQNYDLLGFALSRPLYIYAVSTPGCR